MQSCALLLPLKSMISPKHSITSHKTNTYFIDILTETYLRSENSLDISNIFMANVANDEFLLLYHLCDFNSYSGNNNEERQGQPKRQ